MKLEQLLSDTAITELYYIHGDLGNGGTSEDALIAVRDFYEAKITSGELMVVKTTSNIGDRPPYFHCRECGSEALNGDEDVWNFCPNCGSKIIG